MIHRQHAGGFLIPRPAHQNGMLGTGVENIVKRIIKKNIGVNVVLSGAHVNMVCGNLREFFHDALCADTHKLGRHGRAHKNLHHLAQLADEFLCAFVDRLIAVKIRFTEKRKNSIRTGTQFTPFFLFINGHRGVELMLLVGQRNGIGGALHQKVINIQSN